MRELRPNRRIKSSTVVFNCTPSARSSASIAACAKIIACALGGVCSHISGGKGG